MSFYDAIRVGASGAADDLEIARSARFRGATDQRFDRTLSTTSSSYTVSMWFKTTPVTTNFSRGLFTLGPANNTEVAGVVFNTDDKLIFYGGNGTSSITNARVFRDTSAWYHFTYSVNSNNFTAYINGESLQTGTVRSLDTTSNGFRLGGWWGGYDLFQGYIADFYLVDGSALTPSSFTETNAETGQLVPKLYTGSFGTSGAHLLFDDNSGTTATTLGKDSSGNGNNFTPTSFAVSDAVKDSPTNNFPTWNPLSNYDGLTLAEGNLKATSSGSWKQTRGSMGVSSGKWYFEIRCNSIAATEGWIAGIHEVFGRNTDGYYWYNNSYTAAGFGYAYGVQDNNQKRGNTSSMDGSFSSDVTAGKVVGIRMNLDDNEILISVDGVDKGKMYDIQSGITYAPAVNIYGSSSATLNCGQDSTFHGQESSGGNTDSGGIGDFAYAVPSGYKALCSANLTEPTIKLPNKHFDTLLWTGNASYPRTITGLKFKPDWFWTKSRSNAFGHPIFDSVRGTGSSKGLRTDDSGTEGDASIAPFADISSFNFTSGTDGGVTIAQPSNTDVINGSGYTTVAWNWNAGDTDSATYRVVVVSDSGNKYRFRNSANTATFAQSAVTLNLAEGGTYTFDQSDSTMSSHPMKLSTTANGTHGGGSSYNTGVTYELDGSTVTESAFVSGFSSATSRKLIITVAASAPTLYYYCHYHSGMGGQANTNSTLGSTNFDGTSLAVVKANTTAGFSIVTYTGTGSVATVGHGLGVAPQVVITKPRSATGSWGVLHTVGDPTAENRLHLNDNGGYSSYQGNYLWNDTVPTSSVFTVKQDASTNASSVTYVAYVFSSVVGYSKFGKYTGNGSTNGTFVFTNFRPAVIILKRTNSAAAWVIHDNKRSGSNPDNDYLHPDNSQSESDGSSGTLDILSNGFKLRMTAGTHNGSGDTFIYLAFAESPFKNSRAR